MNKPPLTITERLQMIADKLSITRNTVSHYYFETDRVATIQLNVVNQATIDLTKICREHEEWHFVKALKSFDMSEIDLFRLNRQFKRTFSQDQGEIISDNTPLRLLTVLKTLNPKSEVLRQSYTLKTHVDACEEIYRLSIKHPNLIEFDREVSKVVSLYGLRTYKKEYDTFKRPEKALRILNDWLEESKKFGNRIISQEINRKAQQMAKTKHSNPFIMYLANSNNTLFNYKEVRKSVGVKVK